jgi:hypothetical protein
MKFATGNGVKSGKPGWLVAEVTWVAPKRPRGLVPFDPRDHRVSAQRAEQFVRCPFPRSVQAGPPLGERKA